jgi:hypothetical protein
VARYNQRSGAAGRPGRDDPRWQQWRRDQVTGLVRRIYLDCLAVRPRVKVTAATIGWGSGPVDERTWRTTSAYRNVFQDWLGWLHDGIVDVVMPMHYDNERDPTQKAWFDQWLAWVRERKGKRQVAAGVGLFLNTPADGLAQIRRALEPSAAGARLDGVALYSYAVTNEPARGTETPTMPNAEFLRALAGPSALHGDAPPPFGERAVPPAMPWKVDPGAHVRGTALLTGAAADGAIVRYEGPDRGEAAVDGNGFWGVVDLKPGSYVFTLLERGAARGMMAADLAAGQVTQVNLAGQ